MIPFLLLILSLIFLIFGHGELFLLFLLFSIVGFIFGKKKGEERKEVSKGAPSGAPSAPGVAPVPIIIPEKGTETTHIFTMLGRMMSEASRLTAKWAKKVFGSDRFLPTSETIEMAHAIRLRLMDLRQELSHLEQKLLLAKKAEEESRAAGRPITIIPAGEKERIKRRIKSLKDEIKRLEKGLEKIDSIIMGKFGKIGVKFKETKPTCFIATVCFGEGYETQVLRLYRDLFLKKSTFGRALIWIYYKISPTIAKILRKHERLKALTKRLLIPFVKFAERKVKHSR